MAYSLLYLTSFLACFSFVKLEIRRGRTGECSQEYFPGFCRVKLNCVDRFYIDYDYDIFRYDQLYHYFPGLESSCSNEYIHINGYDYVGLTVQYTKINTVDVISDMNDILSRLIIRFDLSHNEYYDIPDLPAMDNLKYLSLSMNHIRIARIYNEHELRSLEEIDLSHNEIFNLDVNGEYVYENLLKLNLSHNELFELTDSIFDKLENLNDLDLSYNQINTINMMTFEGVKNLSHLNLSHNFISDLNKSLFRFNKLEYLDLSFNNIDMVKNKDLRQLKKLKELNLRHNVIKLLESNIFTHMQQLTYIDLTNNLLRTIDKDIFLNNTYLTSVNLANNYFEKLPNYMFKGKEITFFSIEDNILAGPIKKGTFDGLGFVSDLILSNQFLTTLEDYAFFGLEKLTSLSLHNNSISLLSKKCFRALQHLSNLDLSNNKILSIEFDKDDLINLRYLNLRNNFLVNIKPKHLDHLSALHFLDLTNNNITVLESKSFKSLQDLTYFEISHNPLSGAIDDGTFSGLHSLPTLDISGTELTIIKNNSFNGMTQLIHLNVSHSNISEVEYNTFSNTGALISVDLSFNRLSSVYLNSKDLLSLKIMLLNNNQIKFISPICFKGLSGLFNINLAHNDIDTVDGDAFYDQIKMKTLDLSFNRKLIFNTSIIKNNHNLDALVLSGIRSGTVFNQSMDAPLMVLELADSEIRNINLLNLTSMPLLIDVNLKHNEIQEIKVGAFSKMRNLKFVDLSYNHIAFIQSGVFKDNVELYTLNISHNALYVLSYGIFRGLNNLHTLDISFNNIRDLKSERFYDIENLSELIVDNNKIDTFDAEDFNNTKLTILSIGDNPIPCEILINLNKRTLSFVITAIKIDEHRQDNFHGIVCSSKNMIQDSKGVYATSLSENDKTLIDIKDILLKFQHEKHDREREREPSDSINDDRENWKNMANVFEKLNEEFKSKLMFFSNYLSTITKSTNNTNALLQEIINVVKKVNAFKVTTPIPIPKNNTSLENIMFYINKLKQDLENTIISEKETIMNEFENKISVINSRLDSAVSSTSPPSNEKLQETNVGTLSGSIFTESCVALILVILMCYVSFKFYKSKMFIRKRRSSSTRELPESMESPNL